MAGNLAGLSNLRCNLAEDIAALGGLEDNLLFVVLICLGSANTVVCFAPANLVGITPLRLNRLVHALETFIDLLHMVAALDQFRRRGQRV